MRPAKRTNTRRGFLANTAGISMFAGGAAQASAAPQAARPKEALWPPFEKLQARLEQWGADYKPLCKVEILGKSAQGRPLYAVSLTDASAPPENKEHVLLTALHAGIERSGTTSVFSMLRWLLSGDPTAREIMRRQFIVAMPIPNPDGYVLGSPANTAKLAPYQSWTLDGPKDPEKNPEAVAVQTIMDRFQPEVHADFHGVDLAFPGNIMIEESGQAYSNVALRPFYHAIVSQMNAAAEAEGYPSDLLEEDSERVFWGPPLDSIAEKTWVGRANPYAALYCYNRYHTMILASEIAWERSGVLRHRRLLEIGNEIWPGEYYPGYPTRVAMTNHYQHMLTAYGRTAADRRASRVELWTKQRQITIGLNNPGTDGMAVFVCATSPAAANQWLSDATLVNFAQNIGKHPKVNAGPIRQFVERYPHPDYPGQWGRAARLQLTSTLPLRESGDAAPIEHGLAIRMRIPYPKSRITDLRLNGHPIPGSETNGYVDWVARAYHYVQVNIPPEISKSERFFVVTCGYDPGERRVQAEEWQSG